jgi:hypothetical protein
VWSDRDVMIRVFASMRSPVGGIQVYDHFEFNVTPLRVSITGTLWQHIYEYIFPALETGDPDKTKLAAAVQAAKVWFFVFVFFVFFFSFLFIFLLRQSLETIRTFTFLQMAMFIIRTARRIF